MAEANALIKQIGGIHTQIEDIRTNLLESIDGLVRDYQITPVSEKEQAEQQPIIKELHWEVRSERQASVSFIDPNGKQVEESTNECLIKKKILEELFEAAYKRAGCMVRSSNYFKRYLSENADKIEKVIRMPIEAPAGWGIFFSNIGQRITVLETSDLAIERKQKLIQQSYNLPYKAYYLLYGRYEKNSPHFLCVGILSPMTTTEFFTTLITDYKRAEEFCGDRLCNLAIQYLDLSDAVEFAAKFVDSALALFDSDRGQLDCFSRVTSKFFERIDQKHPTVLKFSRDNTRLEYVI